MAVSKTDKLVTTLKKGGGTAASLMTKCGFASINSVYATISHLREEGYNINSTEARGGVSKYTLSAR